MKNSTVIGKPIDRIDGSLKVSGSAKYAAEFNQKNMAYAFPIRSTIGKGSIKHVDTSVAKKAAGVINILTYENALKLAPVDEKAIRSAGGSVGELMIPMQNNLVHYWGQYVALAVAETYEEARAAAALVKITYIEEKPAINL
ncbi:MAG: xanthine dehydrogenase family protein molybdopterin-binding subunit, partial [Pedobacter sp.]|nr:xanthine dehydrogenase family protein molybdopterin-binding subunit [Pedobacter sp.]